MDRTADTAIGQGHDLDRLVAEQLAVDRRLAELVLDHRDLQAVIGLEDVLEQRRLARAEEAGEHGHRNLRGDCGISHGYFQAVK
ncbi:hypothetical protein FQZ97_1050950 [compost metagenome]